MTVTFREEMRSRKGYGKGKGGRRLGGTEGVSEQHTWLQWCFHEIVDALKTLVCPFPTPPVGNPLTIFWALVYPLKVNRWGRRLTLHFPGKLRGPREADGIILRWKH